MSGERQAISDLNTFYFGVRYPILLPFGSQMWDEHVKSETVHTNPKRTPHIFEHFSMFTNLLSMHFLGLRQDYNVSQLEWLAWMIFERPGQFSPFVNARRLSHQFVVDAYLTVERSRIRWVILNQDAIKADLYQGLKDTFDANEKAIGRKVILPSTFAGSPRQMSQLYHDAIALVREYGYPSLFITMTANPAWPEITACLQYGQSSSDRPDIVCRVFKLKLDEMMRDLITHGRLGRVVSYLMVVEFQKRGLPHVHILLILDESSRPKTAESIDNLVSATIPDAELEPKLYELVTGTMLHGPCKKGFTCWQDSRCTLRYPKPFVNSTTLADGSYPSYKRPDDGRLFKKGTTVFHNGHVVPYNRFLLLKYSCHINVEIPVGSRPIKYLYKYLTKGHDKTRIEMTTDAKPNDVSIDSNDTKKQPNASASTESRAEREDQDETLKFTTYRWISAIEGKHCWYSSIDLPSDTINQHAIDY